MHTTHRNRVRRLVCTFTVTSVTLVASTATPAAPGDPPCPPGNHSGFECPAASPSPPEPSAGTPSAPAQSPPGSPSYGGLYPGSGGTTPGAKIFIGQTPAR